jgi:hypothetical protein
MAGRWCDMRPALGARQGKFPPRQKPASFNLDAVLAHFTQPHG